MVSIGSRVMSVARTLGSVLPASLTRAPLTFPNAPTGESLTRFAAQGRPTAKPPQLRVGEVLNNGIAGRLGTWDAQMLALKLSDYVDEQQGAQVLRNALQDCRDAKGIIAARKLYSDFRIYNRIARATASGYTPAKRANEADAWLRTYDPTIISTYDVGNTVDLTWLKTASVPAGPADAVDAQQRNVLSILAAVFPAADVSTRAGLAPYWHRSTVQVSYDRSYDVIVQDKAMYDRVMADIDYLNAVPGLRSVKLFSSSEIEQRDEVLASIIGDALSAKATDFTLAQTSSLGDFTAVLNTSTSTTDARIAEVTAFIVALLHANGESKAAVHLDRY